MAIDFDKIKRDVYENRRRETFLGLVGVNVAVFRVVSVQDWPHPVTVEIEHRDTRERHRVWPSQVFWRTFRKFLSQNALDYADERYEVQVDFTSVRTGKLAADRIYTFRRAPNKEGEK